MEEKKGSKNPLNGVGLKSMLNRAKLFGATMVFDSNPGNGTSVIMNLPTQSTIAKD
jgi:signal transduction histidine kinase